ncbi:MAG: hypothetical protein QMD23_06720 [Candidatus Bathyarchaeia archaeon]|nr:hypothetical protein [Candidatus Bathyarchaeia archaeon]
MRDLLIEELKRRGVVVVPEVSFRTIDGRRLVPDLLLRDSAEYVVETKLLDAMVQLYDYGKHVTEAKGAFAVLFPAESRRPLVVEADTGFAIRVLRDAVDYVTASVRQLQSKDLEDIFGGRSVFENVLQYEEGKYPLEEMRRAATYLLVNQLLFYHVLTRMDSSFQVINEDGVKRPGDLRQYFEHVLRRDYSSVFGFDVASRLPDSATEAVKKAVIAVKALAPEKIRHDLLGKVFMN